MKIEYYLPKIKKVKIEEYDLYECPLHIDMSEKLNIIFGTNGLGKTTLLNIIQYSIIGPYNGQVKHRNYKDKQKSRRPMLDKNYFCNRMTIPSAEASVEVEYSIGSTDFIVKHSLCSHRLQSVKINNVEVSGSGNEYEKYEKKYFSSKDSPQLKETLIAKYHKAIEEASNFPDINSFILMLTEIMFFSESRNFTFWDADLTKLVLSKFMPIDKYNEYNEIQKLIKKYDSQARLKSYKMSMVKDFLGDDFEKKHPLADFSLGDLEKIEGEIEETKKRIYDTTEEINKLYDDRISNRSLSEDISKKLADIESKWYKNIFPNNYQYFYDKFVPIINENKCPFCESIHIEVELDMKKCFYCNNIVEHKSNVDLSKLEEQQKKILFDKKAIDIKYEQIQSDIVDAKTKINREERRLSELRKKLLQVSRALDSSSNDNVIRYQKLESEKKHFQTLLNDAKKSERRLAHDIDLSIKTVFKEFSTVFYKYVHSFLGDYAHIRLELVGKGDDKLFKFYLNGSLRENEDSLSESQRIFVDMAFRLATLEFFHKDTYFISETPDSTLDYLFENNAVDTFDNYIKSGNTLYLSANARNSSLINLLVKRNPNQVNFINLIKISRMSNADYKNINQLEIFRLLGESNER
ncbi:TPA: AAA family ATPase [Streptococcus suis]